MVKAYGFRSKAIAEKLKRMAMDRDDKRGIGSRDIPQPNHPLTSTRAYLAYPSETIRAARFVSGKWSCGTGKAWVIQRDHTLSYGSYDEAQNDYDLAVVRREDDPGRFTEVRVYNQTTTEHLPVTFPITATTPPPLLLVKDSFGDLYIASAPAGGIADIGIAVLLAEQLGNGNTGTSTEPPFVAGTAFVIFGRGIPVPNGHGAETIRNSQVRDVHDFTEQWAPRGSTVIALGKNTGEVTENQPNALDNGLPIYDFTIVSVEPPEFRCELKLLHDLAPVRRPPDMNYTGAEQNAKIHFFWGNSEVETEFKTGEYQTFNPMLFEAKAGHVVLATIRRLDRWATDDTEGNRPLFIPGGTDTGTSTSSPGDDQPDDPPAVTTWEVVIEDVPRLKHKFGKTRYDVPPGGSVEVEIYRRTVGPISATGESIHGVLHDWMEGDQPIQAGTEVIIEWVPDERQSSNSEWGIWRIVEAECR